MDHPLRLLRNCLALASLAFVCVACSAKDSSAAQAGGNTGRLDVYVVNYPLQYFAQRIGGDRIDVAFPAPPDVDPAFWQPEREVVERYQHAGLILRNGADFAKWAMMASLPTSRVVDTSRAFRDHFITIAHAVTHSHGPGGMHSHAGTAFTTWLDPMQAIEQARAVLKALSNARPEQKLAFEAGFTALEQDLRALDAEQSAVVGKHPDRPFLASHPVFQYLARRYGIGLDTVHWEPEDVPTDEQWAELTKLRASHDAHFMLWEDEPLPATRKRLADMGVECVVYRPCSNVPAEGDFLTVMHANAAALAKAYAD